MKVFLIGNLGYNSNDLNGQTIRTRTVLKTVQSKLPNYNTSYLDTSLLAFEKGKRKPTKFIKDLIKGYFGSRIILLLPARRSIKALVSVFVLLSIHFKKDIHFVAIGGWLFDFLSEEPKYLKYFKHMKYIYVQMPSLKSKLDHLGLDSVIYLPNYRFYDSHTIIKNKKDTVNKLVFLSRVIKEKGIELAIDAVKIINDHYGFNVELDIYGPIENYYRNELLKIIAHRRDIRYLGELSPNDIRTTLEQYDMMIFPTYYQGEGFPGAILDAFSAGIPVIASDWKYNREIIVEDMTGVLFNNQDLEDLVHKLLNCIRVPDKVHQMKINALEEAKKYDVETIAPILINRMI